MPRPVDDVVPVAAVILSYNSRATLAEVLDRVAAQTVQPTRTVVVDNGSGDGTDQMLAAATDVEALLLGENRGVGAGHNAGWREVMGSPDVHFVWALEHDAFPAPDCLERLLATFAEADPSVPVGAAIPAQVVHDGDRPGGPSGPTPTRMLHFNGTLLAVDALAAVGLCSEELFCGQEDRELALRIVGGGWSTQLDPRAVVVHATFRNAQGTRSTIFRRYYGWRNDLWLRVHVRKEPGRDSSRRRHRRVRRPRGGAGTTALAAGAGSGRCHVRCADRATGAAGVPVPDRSVDRRADRRSDQTTWW